MLFRNLLLILLLSFYLMGCRAITRPEVLNTELRTWVNPQITNIGISHFEVDENLILPTNFGKEIHNFIKSELNKYNYNMVEYKHYQKISEEIKAQFAPFYDPISGQRIAKKINEFTEKSEELFTEAYQLDMLVGITIFKTKVKYSNSKAFWHNIKDNFDIRGSNFGNSGIAPAVSMLITAKNLKTGKEYTRLQGLQVIIKKSFEIDGKFDIHPQDIELHKRNIRLGLIQFKKGNQNKIPTPD